VTSLSIRTHVRFIASNGLSFDAYLGDTSAYLSGGYGGWETVSRMRRVALTRFSGADPVRMALPIIFDGYRGDDGQEINIGKLERMARSPEAGVEPPTIQVLGAVPRPDIKKWVIESLDYASAQHVIWGVHNGVAVRLRQDVIVNLLQHVDADRVALKSAGTGFGPGGSPGGARPAPKHKFHIVKHNETIYQISKEEYGVAKWYKDILKANKIRSPWGIHNGQKLRMP
jgi:LysM domain